MSIALMLLATWPLGISVEMFTTMTQPSGCHSATMFDPFATVNPDISLEPDARGVLGSVVSRCSPTRVSFGIATMRHEFPSQSPSAGTASPRERSCAAVDGRAWRAAERSRMAKWALTDAERQLEMAGCDSGDAARVAARLHVRPSRAGAADERERVHGKLDGNFISVTEQQVRLRI